MINNVHGWPVVAAWEVSQLDELWLYALGSVADLPRRAAPIQAIEKKFAEFRSRHPTYRK